MNLEQFEFFQNSIVRLEKCNIKNIEIIETKTDYKTLIIKKEKNYLIYSKYDPLKDIKRMVSNSKYDSQDVIIFLGAGLLYHIKYFLEEYKIKNKKIIIIENNPEIIKAAFNETDLSLYTKENKFIFIINENVKDVIEYLYSLKYKKKSLFFFDFERETKLDKYYSILKELYKKTILKICFIYLDSLGDIVRVLPSINLLKKDMGEIEIDFIVNDVYFDVLKNQSEISNVYKKTEKNYYENQYDVAINLYCANEGVEILSGLNSKNKIGWNGKKWTPLNSNTTVDLDFIRNRINRLYFNFFVIDRIPPLEIDYNINVVDAKLQNFNSEYIIVQPNCGNQRQEWKGKRHSYLLYENLILKLYEYYKMKIIIIGSENEIAENSILNKICNKNIINLTGKTNYEELVFLIKNCVFYVGNDSGPTHLSAALNKPTIAVFGFTSPILNSPIGNNVLLIQADLDCCFRGCPSACSNIDCLNIIKSEDIFDVIQILLHPENILNFEILQSLKNKKINVFKNGNTLDLDSIINQNIVEIKPELKDKINEIEQKENFVEEDYYYLLLKELNIRNDTYRA